PAGARRRRSRRVPVIPSNVNMPSASGVADASSPPLGAISTSVGIVDIATSRVLREVLPSKMTRPCRVDPVEGVRLTPVVGPLNHNFVHLEQLCHVLAAATAMNCSELALRRTVAAAIERDDVLARCDVAELEASVTIDDRAGAASGHEFSAPSRRYLQP